MSVKYAQIMRHLDGCCGTYAPTYITHQPRKKGGEEKRSEKALSNADSRSAFQTSTKNKATYFKIGKKYVVAIVLKKIYRSKQVRFPSQPDYFRETVGPLSLKTVHVFSCVFPRHRPAALSHRLGFHRLLPRIQVSRIIMSA